jgi:hypothetical protein
MRRTTLFLLSSLCIIVLAAPLCCFAAPPAGQKEEKKRDGIFEILLKDGNGKRMTVEELVRDRDLNPGYLYRVKTGGYLGFEEADWVEKLEFKVFDRPVTEMNEYRRFADLLVEINSRIWAIRETLDRYDLAALSLMNVGERHEFASLQAIDDNIHRQLEVYRKLILLKALTVNALNRVIKDRSARDVYADYKKTLDRYAAQLTELTKNYNLLSRRVTAVVKASSESSSRQRPATPAETDTKR